MKCFLKSFREGVFPVVTVFLAAVCLFVSGCTVTTATNPPRSAVEQLLISTAADRAIYSIALTNFTDEKVFLDTTYFDSYDSKYVIGTIRDALSRVGAMLMAGPTNCDIIIEARSGALSIDASETLIGIPNMGVPVPLSGALQIPEFALYKSQSQYSTAKIVLLAYDAHSRVHVFSSGSMVGRAYHKYYKFLGIISFTSTNLPEKKRQKKPDPNQPSHGP